MSARTLLTRLWAKAEAMLLASLGLYMLALASSNTYWLLLNPKYKLVTAAGGCGITLAAFALFMMPAARPGAWRGLVMAGLVLLLAMHDPEMTIAPQGGLDMNSAFSTYSPQTGSAPTGPARGRQAPEPSRVELDGREYVRINTAELYFETVEASPAKLALGYVTKGMVARTPEMDARGEVGLVRVAVSCCLADAVGLGLRVKVDDPSGYEPGQWFKIYGRLMPQSAKGLPPAPQMDGVFITALAEGFIFQAERVEAVEPDLPYIFEVRDSEPYAY
ncbi:MAG: hypothetical protein R6W92_05600 [Desulfocurvibacter africanus]